MNILQRDKEDWDRELEVIPLSEDCQDPTRWELVPWTIPDKDIPEWSEMPGDLSPAQLVRMLLQMALSNEADPETSLQDIFVVDEPESQLLLLFGEVA